MPEFIKKEFRNHPLGTFLVCLTCLSLLGGGLAFVYGQGAKAATITKSIEAVEDDVEAVKKAVEAQPDEEKLGQLFVPRPEIQAMNDEREKRINEKAEAIESQIEKIHESQTRFQQEQRALSHQILLKLSK